MTVPKQLLMRVTLDDCEVQTKRGSGKGGQNRNKRDTAVRIVHRASGAIGESQEQRSQLQNKHAAFRRMAETDAFKTWLRKQLGEVTRAEIEVSEQMRPRFIKTEVKDASGRWVEADLPTPDWWK